MIKKELVLKYGATAHFHGVANVQSSYPFSALTVTVQSYVSEQSFLAKSGLMWSEDILMPASSAQGVEVLDHIENWLIASPESPLHGGFIAPDNSETLEAARDRAWTRVKADRARAEAGNFTYDGGQYQIDIQRVNGAVQLATLAKMSGEPYSVTWTLTDNTTRTLDADQAIGLGLALGERIDSIYAKGRYLRNLIGGAETISAASAVIWSAYEDAAPFGPIAS